MTKHNATRQRRPMPTRKASGLIGVAGLVGCAGLFGLAASNAQAVATTACKYQLVIDGNGNNALTDSGVGIIAAHVHRDAGTPGAEFAHYAAVSAITSTSYVVTSITGTATNENFSITGTGRSLTFDVTTDGATPSPTAYITSVTVCATDAVAATPTPTPSPTATPTPSPSPTVVPTPTPTPSPSPAPSATPPANCPPSAVRVVHVDANSNETGDTNNLRALLANSTGVGSGFDRVDGGGIDPTVLTSWALTISPNLPGRPTSGVGPNNFTYAAPVGAMITSLTLYGCDSSVVVTPTPVPTATSTPAPSAAPSPTPSPPATTTRTPTPSVAPSPVTTPSVVPSPAASSTPSPTPVPSIRATPTPSTSVTATPLPSVAPTGSATAANASTSPGQSQTVSASGFTPGESVSAVLHSTPYDLGIHVADASGAVHLTFTIPAGIETGAHSVTLTGATSGHTAIAHFTVVASSGVDAVSLASTGAHDVPQLLGVAITLGICGGLVLLVSRRARSQS